MRAITISLPVRNLEVSRAFFAELGYMFSLEPSGPGTASMMIGENVSVQLVAEDRFRYHVNGDMGAVGGCGEALISLPASGRREVDEILTRAIVAGAMPWPVAGDTDGYGGGFRDPDGHLWQVACAAGPEGQQTVVPPASPAGDNMIGEPAGRSPVMAIPAQAR